MLPLAMHRRSPGSESHLEPALSNKTSQPMNGEPEKMKRHFENKTTNRSNQIISTVLKANKDY